jgi:amino acid transporter
MTTSPRPIAADEPAPAGTPSLRRALGRWDLAAIGINQVIGGAIFLMPSEVATAVGAWSPLAFCLGAVMTMMVALSLAAVSSRFEGTGGPYLYSRAAFGRFTAFEVGWMQWFARVTSHASVVNGVALAIGYYWAGAAAGWKRVAIITLITLVLTVINVRGIRQGARTVNVLTIGKLVPLSIFIVAGLFFIDTQNFGPLPAVTLTQASTAGLLMIFVFGGYEVLTVPAGEANDPRRHMPFALVTTVIVVGVVMVLAQVVAVGTLPGLAQSKTPLADASAAFMGAGGALLIGVGSIIAMTGNLAGQILTGSRMIFALAEHGDLPRPFARIHPTYRTPDVAILFTAAIALALALSGTFVWMAVASAIARLVLYSASCGAAIVLARPSRAGASGPAGFVLPGGPAIPILAILVSLLIVVGATRAQLIAGGAALAAGAAFFLVNRWIPSGRSEAGAPSVSTPVVKKEASCD